MTYLIIRTLRKTPSWHLKGFNSKSLSWTKKGQMWSGNAAHDSLNLLYMSRFMYSYQLLGPTDVEEWLWLKNGASFWRSIRLTRAQVRNPAKQVASCIKESKSMKTTFNLIHKVCNESRSRCWRIRSNGCLQHCHSVACWSLTGTIHHSGTEQCSHNKSKMTGGPTSSLRQVNDLKCQFLR